MQDLLIVAAGMGSRLRALGNLKPLVELEQLPLIAHAMSAAFGAGLKRATVVTGHNADILEDYLAKLAEENNWQIQTIHNPDFHKPNGLSVLTARELLDGPFCLAMCDHFVEPSLYKALLSYPRKDGVVALGVDKNLDNPHVDLDDVTKVQLKGDYIQDIGKTISSYNAFDAGIFAADAALFDAIEQANKLENQLSISGGMKQLAKDNCAVGADITGNVWIDVDSPEMFELATDYLRSK